MGRIQFRDSDNANVTGEECMLRHFGHSCAVWLTDMMCDNVTSYVAVFVCVCASKMHANELCISFKC